MNSTDITHVSLLGKFSPYQGELWATPVNIKELLSGGTSFLEEVSPEEKYLKSFELEIIAHNEELNEREKVGRLLGRLYNIDKCYEDEFDPMDVFDDVDQYTFDVYDIGKEHHQGIYSDNIFLIDSMIIYPEYRYKKVGSSTICILGEVIETQFNLKVGCFILIPEPEYDIEKEIKPDEAQYDNLKARCERFWDKLGFEPIGDTDYWYFNAENKIIVKEDGNYEKTGEYESQSVAETAIIYEFPTGDD